MRYRLARGIVKPKPKRRKVAGAVYFVEAVTLGRIKIGKAVCARTRFRTLRAMSPDTLALLGVINTPNSGALERELHLRFAASRCHGEWFEKTDELMQFIASEIGTVKPERHWREIRHKRAA